MGNGGCPPTGPRTVPPPPHHPPAPHTGSRPRREDRGGVLDGSSRGGRGGGAVMRGSGCRGRSGGVREGTAGGVGSASPSASVWEGGNTGEAGGGLGEGCWWGGWVRGGVGRSSIMSTERPGRGGQLTHRRGAEGGGRGQQPQRHRAVWPPGRAPPGCRAAQLPQSRCRDLVRHQPDVAQAARPARKGPWAGDSRIWARPPSGTALVLRAPGWVHVCRSGAAGVFYVGFVRRRERRGGAVGVWDGSTVQEVRLPPQVRRFDTSSGRGGGAVPVGIRRDMPLPAQRHPPAQHHSKGLR